MAESVAAGQPRRRALISPDQSPRERLIGMLGLGGFVVGSILWFHFKGLIIQTDTVVIWVIIGMFALTLTDLRRWGVQLLWDWLPLGLILTFYEQSAQFVKLFHTTVHASLQIHFDEFIFGKPLLSVWLQHAMHQGTTVRWFEYPMWALYMTHFFMALTVAGLLWRFNYKRFREYRAPLIVLSTLGFATYVFYPAAPPWYVADVWHQLPHLNRTVFETWGTLHISTTKSLADGLIDGNDLGNQLAAVPSMHCAISSFVACFFWRGARWWLRVILVLYVLGMAFMLIYSGEHYFFDVVVGWFYTFLVVSGFAFWRRHKRQRGEATDASAASTGVVVQPAASA
jgi:membrane-associated phospholipid phosphatase